MGKTVILQSSARSGGNTSLAAETLGQLVNADVIDLHNYTIGQFDYDFKNSDDDFGPLIERIITQYDIIIFATPVYWYSMSGHLKVFLDRISDLLYNNKPLGKQLNGMKMGLISSSSRDSIDPAFGLPFTETANYLKMGYLGHVHTWVDSNKNLTEKVMKNLNQFAKKIQDC